MNTAPAVSARNPFSIVLDVILAPKAAFESLDAKPRWLVAYLIVCVLGMIGAVLQIPAGEHVAVATLNTKMAHDPQYATMSPTQLQRIKSFTLTIQHYVWLVYPVITLIGVTLAALFLLVGNAIGRGQGTFAKYFALAVNVAIVNFGIFYLLVGVLCATHAPDSFSTQSDLLKVIPSLAWLIPNTAPKLTVILESINPFTLWSCYLLALGMQTIGRVSTAIAYVTSIFVTFGSLIIAVPFAQ